MADLVKKVVSFDLMKEELIALPDGSEKEELLRKLQKLRRLFYGIMDVCDRLKKGESASK